MTYTFKASLSQCNILDSSELCTAVISYPFLLSHGIHMICISLHLMDNPGCLKVFAIVRKGGMNIFVQVFWWTLSISL